ncbi:MAG: OmpA family protein [Bacteroidales bacterium]|nr:OmpA family protein [Bacteroidales bacterium]
MRKGDAAYKGKMYASALNYYEKVLDNAREHGDSALIGYTSFKIAECYYKASNYARAIPFYKLALNVGYQDTSKVLYRDYGEMLMMMGDYQQAREMFQKQLATDRSDVKTKSHIKACNFADTAITRESLYEVSNAQAINTRNGDFAAAPFRNKIVFTTSRFNSDSIVYTYTGDGFEDLYETYYNVDGNTWSPAKKLSGSINSSFNEGSFTFDAKNNAAYFMQCNGADGLNKNCNIYYSKYNENKDSWEKPKPFQYYTTEYSSGHPAISPDGMTLYFVSNNPAGMGGTDIWICHRDSLNPEKWTTPENAGIMVNTPNDEMYPYVADNNGLYFSSNGRPGYGRLDIYYIPKVGNSFGVPINLRPPFNSSADDFSLMYLSEDCGLLSSNRIGGVGGDDIYVFRKKDVRVEISGRVISDDKPVLDALVLIKNVATNETDSLLTDTTGYFYYPAMEKDSKYKIFVYKDNYLTPNGKMINTYGVTQYTYMDSLHGYDMNFDIKKIEKNREYEVGDIYYDVDKYELRPESIKELENLVSMMINNPEICIQVNSHTDERASDLYNLILSNNRAKAVVDFINSKGIDVNRLTWKGWGESNPLFPNAKTEEEHQANRRTTFSIVNIEDLKLAKKAEEHQKTVLMLESTGKQEPRENGLYFRVQVAAMSNKNNAIFKKIEKNLPGVPTYCSKDADGLFKYTVGMFATFQDASIMKDEIDKLGYNSFIVGYDNGHRVLINDVLRKQIQMEK